MMHRVCQAFSSCRLGSTISSQSLQTVSSSSVSQLPNVMLATVPKKRPLRTVPVPTVEFTGSSMNVPILNLWNKENEKRTMTLDASVFNAPLRKDILHRVVVWQLAKKRQGTAKTKSRTEVSGSTRKPWKQKGSGRARVGDIR